MEYLTNDREKYCCSRSENKKYFFGTRRRKWSFMDSPLHRAMCSCIRHIIFAMFWSWRGFAFNEIVAISARTVLHNVVKVYMMLNSHFDFTRFVRPFVYFMTLTLFLTDLVTWYTMRGLIPPSPGRNRVKRWKRQFRGECVFA